MKYGVVIGTQRTGTTVLRSILGTHPKIQTFGEVFLNRHSNMKESYYNFLKEKITENIEYAVPSENSIEELFSKYLGYLTSLTGDKDCITFDCKYNFLRGALVPGDIGSGSRPFLLGLFKKNNFTIIHLLRNDVLATYISSLLSVRNQVWATEDLARLKTRSVTVPTDGLLAQLRARVREQDYFSNMLRDLAIEVVYEEMIQDGIFSKDIMNKIALGLGLENDFNLIPKFKKIAPEKSESIENYNQVCQVLKNTEFEKYLD